MHLFRQFAVGDFDAAARIIPVIDYGPYFAGVPGALESVAAEIADACENVGFFYALNHGVSDETIERAFAASRRFHALPLAQKLALRLDDNNIGYLPTNASVQGASTVHKADATEPKRELFCHPRSRTGPSGTDRREAVTRPQSVAAGTARCARRYDGLFCRFERDVRPDAAGLRRRARSARRLLRSVFCQ
jgi:non-haem dioxygenase in morphine synthesis N-terminal